MSGIEQATIKIPRKLLPVFQGSARFRGAYGGRGSAKSFSFAKMLAVRALQYKTRILCAREYQNSIKDSSQAQIVQAIESEPWLQSRYEIGDGYLRAASGTEFLFRGLRHNLQSIKSLTDVGICWIEEAETVSEESYRILIPTIRGVPGELWLTWNPERSDSPTNQRFILTPPQGARIVQMNWRDNPWFPETLEQARREDQRLRPDIYEHVWEGAYLTRTDAQVLRGRAVVDEFTVGEGWDGPYYGADWGFSVDPTAGVRCWIKGRELYVDHEVYGHGVDIDRLPALFDQLPDAQRYVVRGDNARPETISYMQRHGYPRLQAAEKWPGSVEDGVEYLRGFERVVIHPRCPNTAREARLWTYKIDRLTNDVKPDLLPGNDHAMDAIRYALQPMIRKRNASRSVTLNVMGR